MKNVDNAGMPADLGSANRQNSGKKMQLAASAVAQAISMPA